MEVHYGKFYTEICGWSFCLWNAWQNLNDNLVGFKTELTCRHVPSFSQITACYSTKIVHKLLTWCFMCTAKCHPRQMQQNYSNFRANNRVNLYMQAECCQSWLPMGSSEDPQPMNVEINKVRGHLLQRYLRKHQISQLLSIPKFYS